MENELIGSALIHALTVIRETDCDYRIIEVDYILGMNSNFNKTVHRPVVVRCEKKVDRYSLTITYF